MTTARAIFFFTLLLLILSAYSQQQNTRTILGKSYAGKELRSALSGGTQHNAVDNKKTIIKDNVTAISVAEPI